jgi:UrcA family protein
MRQSAILFGVKPCHHGLHHHLRQEIVVQTSIRTRTKSAFMTAISFFVLACAAAGGGAKAAEPLQLDASAANAPGESSAPVNGKSATNAMLTYVVGFSDIDLSTIQGTKLLYARLNYAANVLCESAATWGRKEGQACVNKAIDTAVVRINRPLLSRYHQLRTKGDKAGLVQLAKMN